MIDLIVTGTFDDSVLSSGSGTVSFAQGSGNAFSFGFAGFTLTETDDVNYTGGYPPLNARCSKELLMSYEDFS